MAVMLQLRKKKEINVVLVVYISASGDQNGGRGGEDGLSVSDRVCRCSV